MKSGSRAKRGIGVGLLAGVCGLLSHPCMAQSTTLVSRNSMGVAADSGNLPTTGLPALSADGWYVAFVSFISDFVPGDTNGVTDVFLRNRHDNTTTRISVSSTGEQGDNFSGIDPVEFDGSMGLSLTGSFIAFPSAASNLVAADNNGFTDIFVRDTLTNTTSRISLSTAGVEGNGRSVNCAVSPSVDGRYVVFDSDADNLVPNDTNNNRDIFLRDRVAGTTERVSIATDGTQADQACVKPAVSADGRYVVFTSRASNLAPGGNPGVSIFLRDRTLGQTLRIALSRDLTHGGEGDRDMESAAVSDNGQFVAFRSNDPALVGSPGMGSHHRTFVRDRQTGTTAEVSVSSAGVPADSDSDKDTRMSPDGRYIGFVSSASNLVPQSRGCNLWQAYVHDRTLHTTTQASVSSTGAPGDGSGGSECGVSADGSVAVYSTSSSNLVADDTNGRADVYIRDLAAATSSRASVSSSGFQGTAYVDVSSAVVAMTPDARHVVLVSRSTNLVSCVRLDDYQVFVRDLDTGMTELISIPLDGGYVSGVSAPGVISDDARFVAFTSESSRLVGDDSNNAPDVFLRDRLMRTTSRISVATNGAQHNGVGFTGDPSISADGRFVAFHSDASNLAGIPDSNGAEDVFVRDTALNTTRILSVAPGGAPGNSGSHGAAISGDGQRVAFTSEASDLVPGDTNNAADILMVPRAGGPAVRVSVATGGAQSDGRSENASISGDGRYVAFLSSATNLVPADTNGIADTFVRDVLLGTTTRVSVDSSGVQADGPSIGTPVISRDGRFVAFTSDATNLVSDDTNGVADTFVHDSLTHRTVRVSVGEGGQQGNLAGAIQYPATAISGNGRYVAFTSLAGNLVTDDTNNASDAFLRDTGAPCPLDYNLDTVLNPDDLGDFITDYFTDPPVPGPGGYAIPCPENDSPYDAGYKAAFTVDFSGQCNRPFPDNLGDYITAYFGTTCE